MCYESHPNGAKFWPELRKSSQICLPFSEQTVYWTFAYILAIDWIRNQELPNMERATKRMPLEVGDNFI